MISSKHLTHLPKHLRVEVRGRNGAALAAFGDIAVDFLGADTPLPDSNDGVKLGESTLNRFLLSNEKYSVSNLCPDLTQRPNMHCSTHLSAWFAVSFDGS
jgi:hypothetical protein